MLLESPVKFEDDPLFKTHTGALLFALNYSHGGVKAPSITVLMGGSRKSGKGLGGLDGAAQAGMIQLELKMLPELRRALLVARYSVPSVPCPCNSPCCRGYRNNEDWSAAISWLTEHVLVQGLTGHVSHYRLRRALVERHFGMRESFIKIASIARVHRHTVSEDYKRIHEYLKREERLSRWEIEGILKGAGIVE